MIDKINQKNLKKIFSDGLIAFPISISSSDNPNGDLKVFRKDPSIKHIWVLGFFLIIFGGIAPGGLPFNLGVVVGLPSLTLILVSSYLIRILFLVVK